MTNGEKFKEIFQISQVDDCDLNVYGWLPIHDAIEISMEWWNAEYEDPTTKNNLGVDCVSRQSVLDKIQRLINAEQNNIDENGDYMNYARERVNAYEGIQFFVYYLCPSVTPIRPKGHWIPIYQGDEIIGYRCSECEFGNTFGKGTIGMNFCPNCGADNREVKE